MFIYKKPSDPINLPTAIISLPDVLKKSNFAIWHDPLMLNLCLQDSTQFCKNLKKINSDSSSLDRVSPVLINDPSILKQKQLVFGPDCNFKNITGLILPDIKIKVVSMTFDLWIKNFINMINDKVSTFCHDNKNFLDRSQPQTKFEIYNSYIEQNLVLSREISDIFTQKSEIFNNASLEFVAFQIDIMDEKHIDTLKERLLKLLNSSKLHNLQTQTKQYNITYYFRIEANHGFWNKLLNPRFHCICRLAFSSNIHDQTLILDDNQQFFIEIKNVRYLWRKKLETKITAKTNSENYNVKHQQHVIL